MNSENSRRSWGCCKNKQTIRALYQDDSFLLKTCFRLAPFYPIPLFGFFRFSLCSWSLGSYCPCRWKLPLPPNLFQHLNTSWACGCIQLRFISSIVPKQTSDKERHTPHSIGLKRPPPRSTGGLTSLNPHVHCKVWFLTSQRKNRNGQWYSACWVNCNKSLFYQKQSQELRAHCWPGHLLLHFISMVWTTLITTQLDSVV